MVPPSEDTLQQSSVDQSTIDETSYYPESSEGVSTAEILPEQEKVSSQERAVKKVILSQEEELLDDKDDIQRREWRFLGQRISALIEIVVFMILALAIDQIWLEGDRLQSLQIHPFWLIIILISIQYGSSEAIIAALISSIALLGGNLPERSLNDSLHDYFLLVILLPLGWFTAAVIFGELSGRHIRQRNRMQRELQQAEINNKAIVTAFETLNQHKERLELKLATQLRSVISTYESAQAVEKQSPNEVLEGAKTMVETLLAPEGYTIYLLQGQFLMLHLQSGHIEPAPRVRYSAADPLFRKVVGDLQVLSIQNPDDEAILQGEGVLAGPLYGDHDEQVVGMLKIEMLPFSLFNLTTQENFKVICQWIGAVYLRSQRYQLAKSESMRSEDGILLSAGLLDWQIDFLKALARRLKFAVALLEVQLTGIENLTLSEKSDVSKAFSETTAKILRKTDFVFENPEHEYGVILVLPNATADTVHLVENKFSSLLLSILQGMGYSGDHFKFETLPRMLHEVESGEP